MSMQNNRSLILAAGLVLSMTPAALGQRWEVGAGGGASFYNSKTVTGPDGSVDARLKPGFGFNAYLGQIGNRLGGEIGYTLLLQDFELSSGGKSYALGGRSQSIHYDLSFYFNKKTARIRPYLLAGGGMRQYTATGSPEAMQPFMRTVVLTNTSEWQPLVTTGGGIRFTVNQHVQLRTEVRVFLTQSAGKVITPVNGTSLGGWFYNIVPMVNLSYVW